MPVLNHLAYLAFGIAVLLVLFGVAEAGSLYVSAGLSAGLSGVLFLAAERVITLLTEIRDSLSRQESPGAASSAHQREQPGATELAADLPNRSAAEIDADIVRLRDRLSRKD